jgi:hypothetical protein
MTTTEIDMTEDEFDATYDAMLSALRFALPFMEDLANSSTNANERRAARLMRAAIAKAERG